MTARSEAYTVGWVCALPTEFVVACELLDEEYIEKERKPKLDAQRDPNLYTFGRIHEHNVVIACLPKGRYGITSAAIVAERMRASFPAIKFGLLVGIAGGAPSLKHDIRLGDVVISSPTPGYAGVIQYDFGKAMGDHFFQETGHLAPPPEILLNAVANLEARHERHGHGINETIAATLVKNKRLQAKYSRPKNDELYEMRRNHFREQLVQRKDRPAEVDNPAIHYGLIASANQLMRDRGVRDILIAKYDVLCFEMEAAGLMNNFPCLVIRGICDYSDMFKNDDWQGYAAATAAAYARELLEIIPGEDIEALQITEEAVKRTEDQTFAVPFSLENVPLAKAFIDRPKEMQKLEDALLNTSEIRSRRMFVLRGLGGIGKTQLAVHFMRLHSHAYSAVLWLNGSNRDSLRKSIADFANRIPSNSGSEQDSLDKIVGGVLNWLQMPGNDKWLMVFDNVDQQSAYSNSDNLTYDIKKYLPNTDHGSILITTRLTQLESLGPSDQVAKVDTKAAQAILASWHTTSDTSSHDQALLERLDGLPLAIAQAGAYLQQSGITTQTYLRLYDEQDQRVAEALHKSDVLLDYDNRSIWTTWDISYNTILKKNERAAKFLVLWSFLDPSDFWFEFFEPGNHWLAKELALKDLRVDELEFIEDMKLLRSYSLIEGSQNSQGYIMHPVVHRWMYFCYGKMNRWAGLLALDLTGDHAFRFGEDSNVRLLQRLLPHANMCILRVIEAGDVKDHDSYHENPSPLQISQQGIIEHLEAMSKLGLLYYNLGKFDDAESMYRRAIFGAEEPSNNRSIWSEDDVATRNKFDEAETLLLRALAGKEETLAPEDISTISTINDLGNLYRIRGKLDEAETMLARAVTSYEKILGPEDSSTLCAINNLGLLYLEEGKNQSSEEKLREAEDMLLRALTGKETVLGPKHASTLYTVNNLGLLYCEQGKLSCDMSKFRESERMYRRCIKSKEEVLGPKHRSTISTVNNLGKLFSDQGKLFSDQGKLEEAEEMYSRALAGFEEFLGIDITIHIQALKDMQSLGDACSKTRPEKAIAAYERALDGFLRLYGASSDVVLNLSDRIWDLRR